MIRLAAIFLLTLATAHAADVRVSWRANPESDIAGYRLQWSADGEVLREIETDQLTADADDLKSGVAYSFRLCAVNTSGMRSGWSKATTYTVPTPTHRLRITLYSSDSPTRESRREEASFFQPIDGPRRFWWSEIETP